MNDTVCSASHRPRRVMFRLGLLLTAVSALFPFPYALAAQSLKPCGRAVDMGVRHGVCDEAAVIGEVLDVEVTTNTNGPAGVIASNGSPLVLIGVEVAFPVKFKSPLLVELSEGARPPFSDHPVTVGDRVLLTIIREAPVRIWSCGKLRSCERRPLENLVAVEVFRPALWP